MNKNSWRTVFFSEADINYINSLQAFDVLFVQYIYSICLVFRPENYFPQDQLPFVTAREQKNPPPLQKVVRGCRGGGNRCRFLQRKNKKVNLYFTQKKMSFASVIIFTLIIYSTQSLSFLAFHMRPFQTQAISAFWMLLEHSAQGFISILISVLGH